jgi:uncharacterized protein (DUF885 family)
VDRYQLWSRYFLGARIDLQEAHAWGWDEFLRLETEMRRVADRWMQRLPDDDALAALHGSQVDIPDRPGGDVGCTWS